jgi:RNA polymerase sigma-70 factor (ECF subfamily)
MDQLLSRHYQRIYALCRRMARNDADAADACQEALLAIVRGIDKFQGTSTFKTWSHRVASNACLDELRRRQRRPVAVIDEPDRIADTPDLDQQVADRVTIEDALPHMAEEFRAPVVLRDVMGMDYADIADTLGIAPGTVRSRISRGRRQLAALLGNQTTPGQRQTQHPMTSPEPND